MHLHLERVLHGARTPKFLAPRASDVTRLALLVKWCTIGRRSGLPGRTVSTEVEPAETEPRTVTTEGSDQVQASAVLARLVARIVEVLDRLDLSAAPIGHSVGPGDRALVDVDGTVLAVLPPDEDLAGVAPAARGLLDALLDAYQYVLGSREQLQRAIERAERAERDALEDHLTKLPNRRAWERALEREQARSDRNETQVAVAVADIDDLKHVNDHQGHLAGDLLIRHAAEILRGAFRGSDFVARIGGDEFAVLVVDYHDHDPDDLAQRVRTVLAVNDVAASVGAAAYTHPERLTDVFHRADQAMYAQKHANNATASRPSGSSRLTASTAASPASLLE